MKLQLNSILIGIVILFSSCIKDIDFNQANELELTPSYVLSLINFEIPQTLLVDPNTNVEITEIRDESIFTALNNNTAQNYLERVELIVDIENSFNRNFVLLFEFLDQNDNPTYTPIVLNVSANNANFMHKEDIIVAKNSAFLNSQKIRTTLQIQPNSDGSIIDVNIPQTFMFKSAAELHFRVRN